MCTVDAADLMTLKARPQFLAVAGSGRRWVTKSFVLQALDAGRGDGRVGIGFTASKKVGKAVIRNRAKRRLRVLARDILTQYGKPGWDYVLVARSESVERPMSALVADLKWALRKLAVGADTQPGRRR